MFIQLLGCKMNKYQVDEYLISYEAVISIKIVCFGIPFIVLTLLCLQWFDAVCWAAGRASGLLKTELWGAGMVVCLG